MQYILKQGLLKKNIHSFSTLYSSNPTIYALSSGINTAISIVRISGPKAYQVLNLLNPSPNTLQMPRNQLFQKYELKPRMMTLRSIYGPNHGLIDKCLMVYFRPQNSYTGEELFEIHIHGSKAVVAAIFKQFSNMNFAMAKRGQFTRRAVLNKRMDLQEAEAIGDLISSEKQFQRQVAVSNLMGKNKKFLERIRSDLIQARTIVEAFIEFQQEEVGSGLVQKSQYRIKGIVEQLKKVLQSSRQLQVARQGVRVSIVGRPNVGKSTLINGLTKRQMAIVSPIPGTTRDLIEGELQLQGFRIKLVDTAGVRQSQCPIQQEGIRRTNISMSESHLLVVLFDISDSKYEEDEDSIVIQPHSDQMTFLDSTNAILVVNKLDILHEGKRNKQIYINKQGIRLPADVVVSLKGDSGVQKVASHLGSILNNKLNLCSSNSSQTFFTRARYMDGIERCCQLLQGCQSEKYADLLSIRLSNATNEIEELVGKVDSQQILDSVFSTFCIGK